jgi:hypothetical protein
LIEEIRRDAMDHERDRRTGQSAVEP